MSIQFRTRSQTVVDYTSFIGGSTNELVGCCYEYNSTTNSVTTSSKTISECNLSNGYFLNGDCSNNITIIPSSRGCCCACKNKTSSSTNYLKQTTFCECQDLSGYWTLGDCPSPETDETLSQYCISPYPRRIDYREKRACCYPEFTANNNVTATCEDVCTEKECADKAIFPYTSTFYSNGRKCFDRVGEASPAVEDCSLNVEQRGKIINSCINGTNIYSWSLANTFSGGPNKTWFDLRFPGQYLKATNNNVFYLDSNSGSNTLILGPWDKTIISSNNEAKASNSIGVKKICPGTYSKNLGIVGNDKYFDGYFAILDSNDNPVYIVSSIFAETFNPSFPPIPSENQAIPSPALDIIAARYFSAIINSDNRVKIFGRFYNSATNEYRNLNISDKLIKLYQHNIEDGGDETDSSNYFKFNSIGFIGQKIDKTFQYYSPFGEEVNSLRQLAQSIPAKDYIQVSFGMFTFCGIDSSGIMNCVSLNPEIQVPLNTKFKLVSCSNQYMSVFSNNFATPITDYCYAVDIENRIIRLSSTDEGFDLEKEPNYSITDVRSISCRHRHCDIVVEPDENICNNQMIGSCCYCNIGIPECSTKTRAECTALNGNFTAGGICCSDNPVEGCEPCTDIANLCNDNRSYIYYQSSETQSDLPSDELTYYQDGLYVGIFEPGTPINPVGSTVKGNQITGVSNLYQPNIVGYGTTSKKWAIIVAPVDFDYASLNNDSEFIETIPASLYDGIWNTYGDGNNYFGIQCNFMEKIRINSRISGWYLPSKNELEFINYKLNPGFTIPELFNTFSSEIYLSSTPYFKYQSNSVFDVNKQKFENFGFMYGQSFSKKDYGSIYLVPRKKKINIRLIRRIELE